MANLLGSAGLIDDPWGFYTDMVEGGDDGPYSPDALTRKINFYLTGQNIPWKATLISQPELDFLCDELLRGQRIGLYIKDPAKPTGHFVTFAGWKDYETILIQDPDRDGWPKPTDGYDDYVIDPKFPEIPALGDFGLYDYAGDGASWWVERAITLCPVPDRGSTACLLLAAVAACCLLGLRPARDAGVGGRVRLEA